ncbi:MAG: addiction module toxin, HicA family [Gammaproteobacteria bacterium]|nr:addiction module toxin, HicA family [Gammaproteobacteria bacterium]
MPKVGDAIRLIRADGWLLARTRGSHRQYWHPGRMERYKLPGSTSPANGFGMGPTGSVLDGTAGPGRGVRA